MSNVLKPGSYPAIVRQWLSIVLLAAAFCVIAFCVASHRQIFFDLPTLHWVHAHSSPTLDTVMVTITTIGNIEVLGSITLLISAGLWSVRRRQSAQLLVLSVAGASLLDSLLKQLFQRPRPLLWPRLVAEAGYSFPSGHAMASSAFALGLIAIAWNTRYRLPVLIAAPVFAVAIGYSRLYLGVHYPTDILAGWIASALWLLAVLRLRSRLVGKTSDDVTEQTAV